MKKNPSPLGSYGIILFILLSAADWFVDDVPDYVYIPIAVFAVILIFAGMVVNEKRT